jgi:hypothetical protein
MAWAAALRDIAVLLPVLGSVLISPRRAFAESLWVTSSLNVQLLFLAAVVVATLAWPKLTTVDRWLVVPPLLAALAMQVVVGSRKEILLGILIAVPVLWLRASRRGLLVGWTGVLVAVVLALPAVRDGDFAAVPTEVALPGYSSVAALYGQISQADIPYNFSLGIWSLLPSEIRPVDIDIDIGGVYAQFGFQSVAVGATPWLEAKLGFPDHALVAAGAVIVALHLALPWLVRSLPIAAVTAVPFLLLLGRSTFWLTVFGATYLTLLAWVALKPAAAKTGLKADAGGTGSVAGPWKPRTASQQSGRRA